jgi:hypothetical protein
MQTRTRVPHQMQFLAVLIVLELLFPTCGLLKATDNLSSFKNVVRKERVDQRLALRGGIGSGPDSVNHQQCTGTNAQGTPQRSSVEDLMTKMDYLR